MSILFGVELRAMDVEISAADGVQPHQGAQEATLPTAGAPHQGTATCHLSSKFRATGKVRQHRKKCQRVHQQVRKKGVYSFWHEMAKEDKGGYLFVYTSLKPPLGLLTD